MASRLYPTTRHLFRQVFQVLLALGLATVLPPLPFALMALYVTGLILLDRRQNGRRMAKWLPARAHDAFNRLLRVHFVPTRAVMKAVIHWAKCLGEGYLVIDEDTSLPWQKPQQRLTPQRVRQSLKPIFVLIGSPVREPKPRGKPPGWPKGRSRTPKERYKVVKKGIATAQSA